VAAPDATARLWPHYDLAADEAGANFLFSRLLEDGAAPDLRWLFARHGEAAARRWIARRASRALSARSRAYWSLVLDTPAAAPPTVARELWPLA
jgi:hypothetical protein